ncbi:MAG: hypothetical protein A2527_09875 [Candidatus Lambdaproteobacteria bacterium RIFOXYD2_FULL_50_16]|uniref:Uncharacterized protein n=1 Tax=Candidatus Lambdaproteobacteria bacterium RIFOXYD2_FULL_50_16 TaxID=1817772 RepID=A0A1F6G706_9PROT|nr:MAG: hypothetical protein A2527_09875 [Candidatus Lambdaproteobacteria bacterium RIFOXYD2_FULL_50_16]
MQFAHFLIDQLNDQQPQQLQQFQEKQFKEFLDIAINFAKQDAVEYQFSDSDATVRTKALKLFQDTKAFSVVAQELAQLLLTSAHHASRGSAQVKKGWFGVWANSLQIILVKADYDSIFSMTTGQRERGPSENFNTSRDNSCVLESVQAKNGNVDLEISARSSSRFWDRDFLGLIPKKENLDYAIKFRQIVEEKIRGWKKSFKPEHDEIRYLLISEMRDTPKDFKPLDWVNKIGERDFTREDGTSPDVKKFVSSATAAIQNSIKKGELKSTIRTDRNAVKGKKSNITWKLAPDVRLVVTPGESESATDQSMSDLVVPIYLDGKFGVFVKTDSLGFSESGGNEHSPKYKKQA